jgi:hypothetical protein
MFNWTQIHMAVLKLKQLRQILDISTHPVSPDCAGTVNEGDAKTCTVTYANVGN